MLFNNSYAEHTINLSTSGIGTVLASAADDGVSIVETDLNVVTTCKAGYNLSLSSTVADNNLYLDGNPDYNEPGTYFAPSDGATSLILADNTWGYYFAANDTPNKTSVFQAVPVLGSSVTLRTPAETASTTAINDSFSMYYGVKVTSDIATGYYSMINDEEDEIGKIVYYATLSEDCFRYTVKYDPTGTNLGVSVTGTGTVADQLIAEGATDNLTTSVYDNPTIDDTTYYFLGWNTAQDGSGTNYTSGQSVTDLAVAGESITLYAQWNDCPSENICYYKNNENANGSMGFQSVASGSSVTLLAPNFSLANHGFAGWSEDENAAGKLVDGETVTIYGPNQTITAGDLSIIGLRLYAVWLEPSETLQEWDGCSELEIGDVIALQDARDDNAYAVAKLDDGHCWMIENLRLESDDSTGEKVALSQGYDESFVGLANAEYGNFSDSSSSNSLYNTNGSIGKVVYGDYIGSRFPRYNNSNTLFSAEKPSSSNVGIYGYGNYYTWTATVANTTVSSSMNTVVDSTSICPTGWRVPMGGNKDLEANNDYWALIVNGVNRGVKPKNYSSFARPYYYGDTEGVAISESLRQFPNNLLLSGYYSNNSEVNNGVLGGYWSSVTSANNGAYLFSIRNNRIDPGTDFSNKYYGYSVRCIYEGPLH
ncbi:InlB B-repeat-containing protein [Candidatus Saccharibacteria bacterium]|nr:InlB B-repeat-containing protein [Candidatus Saccharibacteria bacterium]